MADPVSIDGTAAGLVIGAIGSELRNWWDRRQRAKAQERADGIVELTKVIETLKTESADRDKRHSAELEGIRTRHCTDMEDIRKEQSRWKDQHNECERKYGELSVQHTELVTQHEALKAEYGTIKESHDALQQEMESIKSTVSQIKAKTPVKSKAPPKSKAQPRRR